jgi:hypothetical protein
MRQQLDPTITRCPADAALYFLAQVSSTSQGSVTFAIQQCRAGPIAVCNVFDSSGTVLYNAPLRSSTGGAAAAILGCLAAGATTCPGAPTSPVTASVSPYLVSEVHCGKLVADDPSFPG